MMIPELRKNMTKFIQLEWVELSFESRYLIPNTMTFSYSIKHPKVKKGSRKKKGIRDKKKTTTTKTNKKQLQDLK